MNLWPEAVVDAAARALAQMTPDEPWPNRSPSDDEYRDNLTDQARDMLAAVAAAIGVEYAARASDGVGVKPCWDEANADRQVQQWREHHGSQYADAHVVVRVKAGAWGRRDA